MKKKILVGVICVVVISVIIAYQNMHAPEKFNLDDNFKTIDSLPFDIDYNGETITVLTSKCTSYEENFSYKATATITLDFSELSEKSLHYLLPERSYDPQKDMSISVHIDNPDYTENDTEDSTLSSDSYEVLTIDSYSVDGNIYTYNFTTSDLSEFRNDFDLSTAIAFITIRQNKESDNMTYSFPLT